MDANTHARRAQIWTLPDRRPPRYLFFERKG